jgi:hypothetical protein
MVEEHRLILLWPRELEAVEDSILLGDAVLQRALVEGQGREVTEAWVHSVLHLQPDGSDTEANEALEETLVQACLRSFLAHYHRAELAVIAD